MNENITTLSALQGRRTAENLMKIVDGRGYIGGSFAAVCTICKGANKWKPNDVDIFATSAENALAIYDDLRSRGYLWWDSTDVAWTLYRKGHKKIQVVKPSPEWSTFPDDIIGSFDLNVCRAIFITPEHITADIEAGGTCGRVLRINNPLRTLKRIHKYQVRGVEFTDHEMLKVFQAWEMSSAEKRQEWLDRAKPQEYTGDVDSGDWDYDDSAWFEGE